MCHCSPLHCCSPKLLSFFRLVRSNTPYLLSHGLKLPSAKLAELWIIPIFFIIVTVLSMGTSFLLGWIFKLKRSQRSAPNLCSNPQPVSKPLDRKSTRLNSSHT